MLAGLLTVAAGIEGRRSFALAGGVIALLFGLSYVVALRTAMRRSSLVFLVTRADRPNFFRRKKDDLALAAIGAVLAALVFAVARRLNLK